MLDFRCDNLDIFFWYVLQIVNLCSLGDSFNPMLFHWILDLNVSVESILRSSKPCLARVFLGPLPSLQCDLWTPADSERSKEGDDWFDLWCIIIFRGCFVSFCLLFILVFAATENCQKWGVFYQKRRKKGRLSTCSFVVASRRHWLKPFFSEKSI